MTPLEKKLAIIHQIAADFDELASSAASSLVDLSDEELAEIIGPGGHASAVLAHRIIGKLHAATGQLEVLAATLQLHGLSRDPVSAEKMFDRSKALTAPDHDSDFTSVAKN